MTTRSDIIDILKTIKYPGFSRDIVSFGIIKEIELNENNLNLVISIKSTNAKVADELEKLIINKLRLRKPKISTKISFEIEDIQTSAKTSSIKGINYIIAVASAKGGVGKSTVAINLASQLSKTMRVGFLDLDIYGPSLPLMVGDSSTPLLDQDKLIPIEKYDMKLMSFGFLNSGDSPAIWRGPMVSKLTNQFFDNVKWGDLDFLIIDLPPGTGDIQLTLSQKLALDGAVIVTTPQQIALEDVRKGTEMFRKVNVPILGIIENMSKLILRGKINSNLAFKNLKINSHIVEVNSDGEFELEYKVFDGPGGLSESNRIDVPMIGEIHLDPKLSRSIDNGLPYVLNYENSSITQEFEKIVSEILSKLKNE
tara:strand:+ start:20 stop:1120 length:1101 start_codon:yes stop_codon:yes gene_type:complete